jgi:predicted nucleic acid-binding protein
VSGHPFVYGELLLGDIAGRKKFIADYGQLDQSPVVRHSEVIEFVLRRKIHGRGIGWIDAHLLASAILGGLRLWTTDAALTVLATELDVAYQPA